MSQLEHANITVPDVQAAIRFIQLVAPDFVVRHDAVSERGYRWVHLGNDDSYIALQGIHPGVTGQGPAAGYVNYGVNHLCIQIDDATAVEAALIERGYRQNGPMIRDTYRRRLYFFDEMGFEWEMVEYTSDDPARRYLYE